MKTTQNEYRNGRPITRLSARTKQRIKYHVDRLGSPDSKIAGRAECYLLDFYADKAVEMLLPLCRDSNPQKRWRAGWVLAHSNDPRAYEAILGLTFDLDGTVRYEMAIALGILGDPRGIERLEALMVAPDTEEYVDDAAANGMVRMGPAAAPTLIRLLHSDYSRVRRMAAYSLGNIGDESAIDPLSALLASPDEDTRVAAVESLATIGASRCIELIKDRKDSDPAECVRKNAGYWYAELTKVSSKYQQSIK
jgi:HEAT repeat protein